MPSLKVSIIIFIYIVMIDYFLFDLIDDRAEVI